jgi:UDP-N-acetylglucosamine acyltransferase
MPKVHGSSLIEGEVDLADDVEIGPGCVLTGPIRIGPGTRLYGYAWLHGPLEIGRDNRIWPGVSLGMAPQSARFDPSSAGAGTVIGDRNLFREHVSIHRATHDTVPTRIGSDNHFMACSHAGHDAWVHDHCTFANNALLAGHVEVEDGVIMGGNSAVHQFCRIGRGAMISGSAATSLDLMPWFTATELNFAGSLNLVGLRRRNAGNHEIAVVRWVYRIVCRAGLSIKAARERLEARAHDPTVAMYLRFLDSSRRGICTRHGRASGERS